MFGSDQIITSIQVAIVPVFVSYVALIGYFTINLMTICIATIKHRICSALFQAVRHGRESTVRKLFHLGADENDKIQQARSNKREIRTDLTPLHLAALKGHLATVKLLLEIRVDPEARVRERWTPVPSLHNFSKAGKYYVKRSFKTLKTSSQGPTIMVERSLCNAL